MYSLFLLFSMLIERCNTGSNITIDHIYADTQGEVWPKPQYEDKSSTFYTYSPSTLVIKIIGRNCKLLVKALKRFTATLTKLYSLTKSRRSFYKAPRHGPATEDPFYQGDLMTLLVNLSGPCDTYPYLGMDETYNVTISAHSLLTSESIWGLMLGFETASQLFYISSYHNEIRINSTSIVDFPSYAHRGYMLDTARHYISVENILTTLDAMAMNKMNVFHWHIVDDESFPYQSVRFPEVSEKGAYHPTMVYTHDQIKNIIEFARERGIRVIPEFDVTGNVRSWGLADPTILIACHNEVFDGRSCLGPLHPLRVATFRFLRDLFDEVQRLFPDRYIHFGGDDYSGTCWGNSLAIKNFILKNNLSNVAQIHSFFMSNVMSLRHAVKSPVIWQDVIYHVASLDNDTIVQIWKATMISNMKNDLIEMTKRGFKVILSTPWYLDNEHFSFMDLYNASPRSWVAEYINDTTQQTADLFLGGEVCVWTELIDDTNVISKSWPRASAVAELLWREVALHEDSTFAYRYGGGSTFEGYSTADAHTLSRVQEHSCRMRRRGVASAPPVGPGFCLT